ncbi:MAG: hypothetical protein ACE5GC_06050 [Acidimicrobiia bacterium]
MEAAAEELGSNPAPLLLVDRVIVVIDGRSQTDFADALGRLVAAGYAAEVVPRS